MNKLQDCVDELPELYQNIYGHKEYDNESSRNCKERGIVIAGIIEQFRQKKGGKQLKILDLGCAQGYYCFVLSSLGCKVHGIDFLDKNIKVCNAIQEENKLDCTFEENTITKEFVSGIEDGEYDVIMIYSVIHHVCNEYGFQYARDVLEILAEKAEIVLTELALKEEPLYWNVNLPENYQNWFDHVSFYDEIQFFKTHLSNISRPFILYSNKYCYLNQVFYYIDDYRRSAYNGKQFESGKNYYLCENRTVLIKLFRQVASVFADELFNEHEKLMELNGLDFVPKVLYFDSNSLRIAQVSTIIYGELLRNLMKKNITIDYDTVFENILNNCCELEEKSLYHGDIRSWNVCVTENKKTFLIDFGNVTNINEDNVAKIQYGNSVDKITTIQSFISLIYDCLTNNTYDSIEKSGVYGITLYYNLSKLPEKYANFIRRYLSVSPEDITFSMLKKIYKEIVLDGNYYEFNVEERLYIIERQINALYDEKASYILFSNCVDKDEYRVRNEWMDSVLDEINKKHAEVNKNIVSLIDNQNQKNLQFEQWVNTIIEEQGQRLINNSQWVNSVIEEQNNKNGKNIEWISEIIETQNKKIIELQNKVFDLETIINEYNSSHNSLKKRFLSKIKR